MNKPILPVVVLMVLLSACATPKKTFYWGDYQSSLHRMYNQPDKFEANREILKLNKTIDEANSRDQLLAPGIYAHLGYLYSTLGNNSAARDAFEQEKKLYPEATIFMDRILERLQ